MRITPLVLTLMIGSALTACGNQALANTTGAAATGAPPGQALNVSSDQVIARDQARLRQNPSDWKSVDELAGAYLQKVREVGDPSYYPKVDALLGSALRHDPADTEAATLMGTLTLARHQFMDALSWGNKAHALNPYASRPLGVISDAQTQLGRYDEAVASLQQMVNLRPDLSSYSRVSYLRELYGGRARRHRGHEDGDRGRGAGPGESRLHRGAPRHRPLQQWPPENGGGRVPAGPS